MRYHLRIQLTVLIDVFSDNVRIDSSSLDTIGCIIPTNFTAFNITHENDPALLSKVVNQTWPPRCEDLGKAISLCNNITLEKFSDKCEFVKVACVNTTSYLIWYEKFIYCKMSSAPVRPSRHCIASEACRFPHSHLLRENYYRCVFICRRPGL